MDAPRDSLAINTGPVALIFEGGGMRNAYTAAVLATLVEEGINFPKAYGVSAGAELACDYVARDVLRAKALFTKATDLPEAGGIFTFLTGRGFFNTTFVFDELARQAEAERRKAQQSPTAKIVADLAFDYGTFAANPADVQVEALDLGDGTTKAWTKRDMPSTAEVMVRIAASCSYPVFTPKVVIDGRPYIDGGMGTSHGVCLGAARADGFERFFIVRTQPRGFRLPPLRPLKRFTYRLAYATHDAAYEELLHRPELYDRQLDEIDELERQGAVYQFCPKTMPITYMTKSAKRLAAAYGLGLAQAREELPRWREWLGLRGATRPAPPG